MDRAAPLSALASLPAPLPEPKSPLSSRTILVNVLTILAATPLGLKLFAGVDLGQAADYVATALVGLLPILSSYFRARADAPIQGSPLAKAITEAKAVAETAAVATVAAPVNRVDLSTAPLEDVAEQLPAFFERLRRVAGAVDSLVQQRALPAPARANDAGAPIKIAAP